MTDLTIELKKAYATVTIVDEIEVIDWVPALKVAAQEIALLNGYAAEGTAFPRPIECNPDAMWWVEETASAIEGEPPVPAHWAGVVEGFLGNVNTPPSDNGMVSVRTEQYEWINVSLLPAMPTTFNFILGKPSMAGGIQ